MTGRVLLVNAPWGRIYCPSMGLGLLKARLTENGIPCDVLYLHLDWYARLRDAFGAAAATQQFEQGTVSEQVGEWAFAAGRFGVDDPGLARVRRHLIESSPTPASAAQYEQFFQVAPLVKPFIDEVVESVDWSAYDVVGFTTMFSQLNASLALAEGVRAVTDRPKIVFGGSRCEGELGEGVIEGHPVVDAAFTGKPDLNFLDYVREVVDGGEPDDVPGAIVRRSDGLLAHGPKEPVADLGTLPLPDYDDYFEHCRTVGLEESYPKFILVETARGCFWGVKNHCIFCGLLGEEPKYSVRPPEKVIEDIDILTRKYDTTRVMFVDLIMNTKYFKPVFDWMAEDERDFRFFCELKPDIKRDHLETLWRAGCWRAQPGIESFDSGVLNLIDKGTTALQNVACLKFMRDLSMIPSWNFLYGIPQEEPAAYPAMIDKVRHLAHLEPPTSVTPMGLVRNSPAWARAEQLGLVDMRPDGAYPALFKLAPEQIRKLAYTFVADRADGSDPDAYSAEVRRELAEWQEAETRGYLAFRRSDAGSEIIDTRFNFPPRREELSPGEAAVYDMCYDVRRIEDVVNAEVEHGLSPEAAHAAIDRFCQDGWMLAENGECVALALVREDQVPWFTLAAAQFRKTERSVPNRQLEPA